MRNTYAIFGCTQSRMVRTPLTNEHDSRCAKMLSRIHNATDDAQRFGVIGCEQDADGTGNHILNTIFDNQAGVMDVNPSPGALNCVDYNCTIDAWGEHARLEGSTLTLRVNRDNVLVSCFIRG